MRIGYARVSTDDQNLDLQIAALEKAACDRIYSDHGISGAEFKRPGLERALRAMKNGDTLVVWRLDRLGRSLSKLVDLVNRLGKKGMHFTCLSESIDTTSSTGSFTFHMLAALAEFERRLIGERTRAGMAAARARGKHVGRRRAMTDDQCREAQGMLRRESPALVAERFHIHPRTLVRSIKRAKLMPETISLTASVAECVDTPFLLLKSIASQVDQV
ncbi:DNA invertase Pin-like site-specific DNA recombinase [Paraburkholderia sp. BL6665CI2N2]|uniref:recombinase family protein n=1 Tax=Paraburkholderia sp. BL6665CI2N2 TaxID=1938806 RepID=UPI001065ECF3|nr:recombinase family protein [Paraburkholderia sp. BL6665CI2N2]TDY16849.1 DNA invertase Pin-like site-specific DNA recombinase [Paraburkholderia sp. BL6665CI2N2]